MSSIEPARPRPRKPKPVAALDESQRTDGPPAADAASVRQFELDRVAARRHVERIVIAFLVLNFLVFAFIVFAWLSERLWLRPVSPVVTDKVMLALIAGSTAQFGTLAVWVGRNIWRDRR